MHLKSAAYEVCRLCSFPCRRLELHCGGAVIARHLLRSGHVQGSVPWVLLEVYVESVFPVVCYACLTWCLADAGLTKQKGKELLLLLPMQPVRGKGGTKPDYWSLLVPCIHASSFVHCRRRMICPVVRHMHRHKLEIWLQVMPLLSLDLLSDTLQLLTMSAVTYTPSGIQLMCTTIGIVLLNPCGVPFILFPVIVSSRMLHSFISSSVALGCRAGRTPEQRAEAAAAHAARQRKRRYSACSLRCHITCCYIMFWLSMHCQSPYAPCQDTAVFGDWVPAANCMTPVDLSMLPRLWFDVDVLLCQCLL